MTAVTIDLAPMMPVATPRVYTCTTCGEQVQAWSCDIECPNCGGHYFASVVPEQ